MATTLESLQESVTTLSTELKSALEELNFLDIIKTTVSCTTATVAALQTTFNSLNIYESLIYNGVIPISNWSGFTTINPGDYILKGKNNSAYLIPGPATISYTPQLNQSDWSLVWTTASSPSAGINIKGEDNTTGNVAQYILKANMLIGNPITGLIQSPVVTFYNTDNEEITLPYIPYVITKPSTYTLTWGNGTNAPLVPSIVSYGVIR